jgi:dihydropteroate synthase
MIISKVELRFFTNMQLLCREKKIFFDSPVIMGILNVTPDSFFDGGTLLSEKNLLERAEKMLTEGASILDVGGMSSRPGANIISEQEELKRVLPAVELLVKHFPDAVISVDTIRTKVADESLQAGAHIINDISAARFDAEMLKTVVKHNAPLILMHMQGLPSTMQQNPQYDDVVNEVFLFFEERVLVCRKAGVQQLILDVGFGFGKTVQHNYALLKNLEKFRKFELPLLAGLSRKSMICKVLNVEPEDALNGTTVLHTLALLNGADILRVHDAKEARQVKEIMKVYKAKK